MPKELYDIELNNGELSDYATDEQKAIYAVHIKRIKDSRKNMVTIVDLTPGEIKESLAAAMEGKTKEERKVKLESYRSVLEPILGSELEEVYALYL